MRTQNPSRRNLAITNDEAMLKLFDESRVARGVAVQTIRESFDWIESHRGMWNPPKDARWKIFRSQMQKALTRAKYVNPQGQECRVYGNFVDEGEKQRTFKWFDVRKARRPQWIAWLTERARKTKADYMAMERDTDNFNNNYRQKGETKINLKLLFDDIET